MNPYMMPLPYYGGPPGGMQSMQMNPQMDPHMLQYLQQLQQQHAPLTPDQVWPFQHPGGGAPDLPQDKKKQQQQQQKKGGLGLGQVGMDMLYPGGGAGGFPYGISPQMWSSAGKGVASAWGQS